MAIARAAPGKCETPCATQRKGNSHETKLALTYCSGENKGEIYFILIFFCIEFHIEQSRRELLL